MRGRATACQTSQVQELLQRRWLHVLADEFQVSGSLKPSSSDSAAA